MYVVYSLLLTFGFLVLAPRFLFAALRQGKYRAGLAERLGSLSLDHQLQPVIWLHCVSVGETQAARPLVRALRKHFPHHLLVISTITVTGQRLARDVFRHEAVRVFYFPFDWKWTVRRALRKIRPEIVLIMETELWPRFLRECQLARIPVALVNGRLSSRSFRRYHLIKRFLKSMLSSVSLALMQTKEDAQRLILLGMDPGRVAVTGNLKFDAGQVTLDETAQTSLRSRFGFHGREVILAASTHAPEEEIVLAAYGQICEEIASPPRLIIVPRHPERFREVASLLSAREIKWTRRSTEAAESDTEAAVILLDTIGELSSVFPLASIVFVGGSISRVGGHNILEPAAAGCCIITGAHTFNFEAIVSEFVNDGALIQLPPLTESDAAAELASAIIDLLRHPERQQQKAIKARQLIQKNAGATQRTIQFLEPLLNHNPATPKLSNSDSRVA